MHLIRTNSFIYSHQQEKHATATYSRLKQINDITKKFSNVVECPKNRADLFKSHERNMKMGLTVFFTIKKTVLQKNSRHKIV